MSLCSSIQRDLDRFFKSLDNSDFNIRKVTKSAFTQARKKLNLWAFKRLNEVAVKTFYENNEVYTWYGMRVMAVDGSRLVLPNHQTVREEFGVHKFGPNADSERSLALCSVFYDVLNLLAVDSQIAPYASSERDLLYKHLEYAMEDDLILLDREYPSKALLFLLFAKKLHFCVRMKDDWWLEVNKFNKSGIKEQIVAFELPKKDRKLLKDYPEWHDNKISANKSKAFQW